MPVTAASFKIAKPQFAAVADGTVAAYLAMTAAIAVDATWPDSVRDTACIAYTCHLMTRDGLGTDPQSKRFANSTAEYKTIKSGELTLTRSDAPPTERGEYAAWLASTNCGAFFLQLARLAKGGLQTVSISTPANGASAYAKDFPI